jgi:folate-binding Fe-S cluster repair protein YgfZ
MSAQLVQFEGPDAGRFLQAQLATDLSRTDTGQWRWAALLSLKGRVTAHAPLARVEDQRWLWLLPADLHDSVASHLRRYLLRSKLTIESILATRRAVQTDAAPASGQGSIEPVDGGVRLTSLAPGWSLDVS